MNAGLLCVQCIRTGESAVQPAVAMLHGKSLCMEHLQTHIEEDRRLDERMLDTLRSVENLSLRSRGRRHK